MRRHDEDQAEAAARVFGQVLNVLLDATDATTAAIWLLTPSEVFGGKAAVDAIRESSDAAQWVLAEARRDAERWRH